ncbi:Glycosyltransferase 25 family member [Geodia barretti]|uniref:Glycosyltransferase 25 family member n=1 Tax=Geodia barretti TaxID=519541 RepID=A0AA35X9U2_GEOBA|nr:Glycosyltransferase 25 family member [Geodia barretti]
MQGGRGCTWILSQRSTGHGDWFDQPTPTGLWATSSPTEEPGNSWKPILSTVSSQSTNTSPFSLENTLSTSIHQLSSAALYPYLLLRNFYCTCMYCLLCRKEWAQHYPNQNLEVYSANPLLLHPTHYVGDAEWFSDTEPPLEILEVIREKKAQEQEVKQQKAAEQVAEIDGRQKEVRDKAVQRQIELMKKKMKQRSEL